MSFANLLHVTYWFSQPEVATSFTKWFWIGLFLILVLGGIICLWLRTREKDNIIRLVCARYGSAGVTMGILGLLWFFFRQQGAVLLGWRFWLAIWGVIAVIWFYKIIFYHVKRIPAIKIEKQERASRDKYLPGRK